MNLRTVLLEYRVEVQNLLYMTVGVDIEAERGAIGLSVLLFSTDSASMESIVWSILYGYRLYHKAHTQRNKNKLFPKCHLRHINRMMKARFS